MSRPTAVTTIVSRELGDDAVRTRSGESCEEGEPCEGKPSKRLEAKLEHARELAALLSQVKSQDPEKQRLVRLVGEPEASHVVAVGRRGNALTVTVDSAAWATRLQWRREALLAAVNGERGPEDSLIESLRIKVGQATAHEVSIPPTPPELVRKPLDASSRRTLLSAADSLQDPRLRDRLRAIANS